MTYETITIFYVGTMDNPIDKIIFGSQDINHLLLYHNILFMYFLKTIHK